MTVERLEHELVKIKGQVSPEYVGPAGTMYGSKGPCLWAQLVINTGGAEVVGLWMRQVDGSWYDWWLKRRMANASTPNDYAIARFASEVFTRNDQGMPWHQIIDELVPQTKEVEVLEEAIA